MPADNPAPYDDLADQICKRMINLVGIHAVTLLVQRALWITRQKHTEAESIEFTDNGISLAPLADQVDPKQLKLIAEEFFTALIDILTNLVGIEIARKLAEELDKKLKREDV